MTDTSFLVISAITGTLLVVGYWRSGVAIPVSGLVKAWEMLLDIAPNLLVGFILAGMVQVLIPR